MHQCLKFINFGMTVYMFRTVFPSIIRSSRLYIQQQAYEYVKQKLLAASRNGVELSSIPFLMMDGKTVRNM